MRPVAGRPLRDRVRSSATREELRVEPLLLHMERSLLRWLGHLGGGSGEDQGHAGGTMSLGWPGNALVSPGKCWRKCLGRGKSGRLCLDCCLCDPAPDKWKKKKKMKKNYGHSSSGGWWKIF